MTTYKRNGDGSWELIAAKSNCVGRSNLVLEAKRTYYAHGYRRAEVHASWKRRYDKTSEFLFIKPATARIDEYIEDKREAENARDQDNS